MTTTPDPKALLERVLTLATRVEIAAKQFDGCAEMLSARQADLAAADVRKLGGMLAGLSDDLKAAEMVATEGLEGGTDAAEAAHPFPTLESCGHDGVGAISGTLAKEYNRQAFAWITGHPLLAGRSGVAFATANKLYWDQAGDTEADKLGSFYISATTPKE